MALRLLDRLGTLLKADAHGVVESLEDRALLLKQYLREAELAFDQTRARAEALRDESTRLGDTIARHERDVAGLDDDVQLALSGGKEDLARFAIRRLIPRRRELTALRAQLAERSTAAVELAERVERQQSQLEALRTRVRAELLREQTAGDDDLFSSDPPVADEEVELELMRRRPGAGGPS